MADSGVQMGAVFVAELLLFRINIPSLENRVQFYYFFTVSP
jgi:hypothetical protein